MTATARDQERDRLDLLRKQLDEERESFTQATIKLGQERVLIEVSLEEGPDSFAHVPGGPVETQRREATMGGRTNARRVATHTTRRIVIVNIIPAKEKVSKEEIAQKS